MTRPIRSITLGLAWRLFLAQAFTVLFAVVALILTWGDKDAGNGHVHGRGGSQSRSSEGDRLVLDQARWDRLNAGAGATSGSRRLMTGARARRDSCGPRPAAARLPTVGATELGSLVPPYLDVAR